jgi:hypothetical protein
MAKFFIVDSLVRTAIIYGDDIHYKTYLDSEYERLGSRGVYDRIRTAEHEKSSSLLKSHTREGFYEAAKEVIDKSESAPAVAAIVFIEGSAILRKTN